MLPRRTVFQTKALVRDTVVVGRVAVAVVVTDAVDTVLEDVADMVQARVQVMAQDVARVDVRIGKQHRRSGVFA